MIYILPTDTCYGIACAFDDKKNYEKIYKIKKRSFEKPLAILVPSFTWLRENTDLTDEQVNFLEVYDRPFTILTHSSPIETFLHFSDETEASFINKDVYESVSFRVANTELERDLLKTTGPLWLTSANLSNTGEVYTFDEIEKQFEYYIQKGIIEIVGSYDLVPSIPASDVFGFIGESLEIEYVRKG